jgi:hypothetical protein
VPDKLRRELVFVVGLICQPIHFSITSNLIHKPQANTNPFIIGIRTQNIISDKSLDVSSDAGRKHFALMPNGMISVRDIPLSFSISKSVSQSPLRSVRTPGLPKAEELFERVFLYSHSSPDE